MDMFSQVPPLSVLPVWSRQNLADLGTEYAPQRMLEAADDAFETSGIDPQARMAPLVNERVNFGRLMVARALYGISFQMHAARMVSPHSMENACQAEREIYASPDILAWLMSDIAHQRAKCLRYMGLGDAADSELLTVAEYQSAQQHPMASYTWTSLCELRLASNDPPGAIEAAWRGIVSVKGASAWSILREVASLGGVDQMPPPQDDGDADTLMAPMGVRHLRLNLSRDPDAQAIDAVAMLGLSVHAAMRNCAAIDRLSSLAWCHRLTDISADVLGQEHPMTCVYRMSALREQMHAYDAQRSPYDAYRCAMQMQQIAGHYAVLEPWRAQCAQDVRTYQERLRRAQSQSASRKRKRTCNTP